MARETDWTRVEDALMLRRKPDCVPLWELYVDPDVKQAYLGREITGPADEIAFWYDAGYDFVPVSAGFLAVGEVVDQASIRHSDRYSVYGDQEREVTWAVEGEGAITTWEQFEEFPWPTASPVDHLHQYAELLPEGMRIIGIIGKIFTPTWMLMGFEGFAYALMYEPELVAAVFQQVGRIQYDVCLRCLEVPQVAALFMSDDVAYGQGLLVSPKILREHLWPWYAKLGEEMKARGLPYIYHSDGNLWPVMDDIVACGFNALHPIEPKAMDSREVKARYGDQLCLLGNIELDRLSRGTPAEVAEMVRRNIEDLAYDGGYCVGSSNSVTYYVPLDNFVAMIEAAKSYGAE